MIRIFATLCAGLLTVVFLAVAVVLLTACGVKLPFGLGEIGLCTGDHLVADRQLTIAFERQNVLRRHVADLEAALYAQTCEDVSGEAGASVPEIDVEAWEDRDVGLLEGCWMLDSDYRLADVDTGAISKVDAWEMCFDSDGNGSQTLKFDDGTQCRSSQVTAAFDDDGNLVMSDNTNVSCEDKWFIYERTMICVLDAARSASCVSSQEETGSRTPVRLHR